MDVNNTSQVTIGTYFKQWWQNLPPARKKRWWIVLGVFSAIWLAGAIHAPTAVAGLNYPIRKMGHCVLTVFCL